MTDQPLFKCWLLPPCRLLLGLGSLLIAIGAPLLGTSAKQVDKGECHEKFVCFVVAIEIGTNFRSLNSEAQGLELHFCYSSHSAAGGRDNRGTWSGMVGFAVKMQHFVFCGPLATLQKAYCGWVYKLVFCCLLSVSAAVVWCSS